MSEVTFKKGSGVEAFLHEGYTFCINNVFWLLSQYFLQTVKTSKTAVAAAPLTQVHFGPQRKQDKTQLKGSKSTANSISGLRFTVSQSNYSIHNLTPDWLASWTHAPGMRKHVDWFQARLKSGWGPGNTVSKTELLIRWKWRRLLTYLIWYSKYLW